MEGCSIMNNSAASSVGFGGAIFLTGVGSSLRVLDSMFGGNTAGAGAVVVSFLLGTPGGAIVFSNCSFVRNIADNTGGVFWGSHSVSMSDSLFVGNEAINGEVGVIYAVSPQNNPYWFGNNLPLQDVCLFVC